MQGSAIAEENNPRRSFRLPGAKQLGLVVVVVILAGILSYFGARREEANTFLNSDNLLDGIATPMAYIAIMAVGQTCVIITGGIDISVGSILALSALGAASVLQNMPVDSPAWKVLPVAFGISLGIGLLCGLLNGALTVFGKMHPFIVTLGTMAIFRCIANVSCPPKTLPRGGRQLPLALTTRFFRFDFSDYDSTPILKWFVDMRLIPLVVMIVAVILVGFYLHFMIAGRETYAVGGNEEAAKFSGLRVGLIKMRVYVICGLAAGLAGLVSLGRFGTVSTNTGTGYELTVIAAAVVGGASLLGGRGTALGALLGTLVIQLIDNGIYILRANEEYRLGIVGTTIIVAVAVDGFLENLRQRRLVKSH